MPLPPRGASPLGGAAGPTALPRGGGKATALGLLLVAEVSAMSVWFASAAALPAMANEAELGPGAQAALASAVQGGFVLGALAVAASGIADRLDPRRVFAASALGAAAANAALIVVPVGGAAAVLLRATTGAFLAGVYPVGMKIVVGWGAKDRGLLVALVVGALTLGTALPHLASLFDGGEWRRTVAAASIACAAAALLGLATRLGPHHATAPAFDPRAIRVAWLDPALRLAILGYLGHMWELYAMWAWIAAAAQASYGATLPPEAAASLAKSTAFVAIASGAAACVAAGALADRIGRAEVAGAAMAISAAAAVATALSFGGPPWLTMALIVLWGIAIIPDSPQFSALVADAAPKHLAGSLLTLQTALGFALTILTVQGTPYLAEAIGWPPVIALLALGPALGVLAMAALRRHERSPGGPSKP